MSTLQVGVGQQFTTIGAAVAASRDGDLIQVQAGTYTNDFATVSTKVTIQGVGGKVNLVATEQPPNGKAILVTTTDVTLDNIAFSGTTVPDGNGAGVRYEGGNLTVTNCQFTDNQDGLLANADPNGTITISNSEFASNGAGDGYSHNLYVGQVKQLTITDSLFRDAVVGHEIKSRALNTTILNTRIEDGATGSASYSIDLPNGGNAVIKDTVIQKGAQSENPALIHFGGEGTPYAGSNLQLIGDTFVNDRDSADLLVNDAGAPVSGSGLSSYGLSAAQLGTLAGSTTMLSARPTVDASSPATATPSPTPDAAATAILAYQDTSTGAGGTTAMTPADGSGPSYLQWQYINSGSDDLALSTQAPNVFLHSGSGSDALQVTSGTNVLDGGTGSNFLTGGSGTDTFFTDARGSDVVWNTLVNFQAGDAATLWGFIPGVSSYSWEPAESGATGSEGATLRANIVGGAGRSGDGIDASITFAGMTVDQAKGLQVATGTQAAGNYLYLYNPGV